MRGLWPLFCYKQNDLVQPLGVQRVVYLTMQHGFGVHQETRHSNLDGIDGLGGLQDLKRPLESAQTPYRPGWNVDFPDVCL